MRMLGNRRSSHAALAVMLAMASTPVLPGSARGQAAPQPPLAQAKLKPGVDLLARAIDIIRRRYVVEPDDTKLIDDAIRGMLSKLDPDAHYFTPGELREIQAGRSQVGSVGLHLRKDPLTKSSTAGLRIIAAEDGSPAAEVGLRPLDLITGIDDQPITPRLSIERAGRLLSGPPTTPVTLSVLRRGQGDPVRVTMLRAPARSAGRLTLLERGVLVARPPMVGNDTGKAFAAEMARARQSAGAMFRGVVLDLRDSAGGTIGEAVALADAFLEAGIIATARSRNPGRATTHQATSGDIAAGLPVAVLINGGTTGAGEIIAGALKDRKRATIIGTRSFGRASQQAIVPIGERGSGGGALITTVRYLTPADRQIDGKGVEPDIVLPVIEGAACRDGDEATADGDGRCAPRTLLSDPQLRRALEAVLGERTTTRAESAKP